MKKNSGLCIKNSFRMIQALIILLLVFLLVQGVVLWRVCERGSQAINGLEQEGLTCLRLMASLQENLAIYRLRSFELMFAQETERPGKITETTMVQAKNDEIIKQLDQLYPAGEGRQRVSALAVTLKDYVESMSHIRNILDKDFAGAMKQLDTEVPAKVKALNNAADLVKEYCTGVAEQRTALTVSSFSNIRQYVLWLGISSVAFAGFAVVMITVNSHGVRRALNNLVEKLGFSSSQVNAAAAQVSHAGQSLAQGSGEQAASIEETSTSLEEMASMIQRNSENASKANDLAKEAREAADNGAADMQTMNTAMQAIKASSDDIAKIIKTIDEIAFQTNILALNAAVEAARAGEAGMGFAVVADEVRNLAQRSATAAKETTAKIEGAITKTAQGVDISLKVTAALNGIVIKARQVDELASEVANASREQTQSIKQINASVGQMDKVTQANAVSAEESAAAAQELNAQSVTMKEAVGELLFLVDSATHAASYEAAELPTRSAAYPAIPMDSAATGTVGSGGVATQKILAVLAQNPSFSRREIAEALGNISEDRVKYHLEKLKASGQIRRQGGDKGEH